MPASSTHVPARSKAEPDSPPASESTPSTVFAMPATDMLSTSSRTRASDTIAARPITGIRYCA